MIRPRRFLSLACALAVAAVAACDDGVTGPDTGPAGTSDRSFSRDVTSSEMEEALASGTRRVEIELASDGLVARRVELERREETSDDEEIESPVEAVEASGGSGTIVLELGGLRIDFDDGTELEARDDGRLTVQQFVDRIETALAEGRRPSVEVKRRPAAEAQAPDDASFVPREIQLQSPDDDREIEINVDADNVESVASPPPQAILRVLGLEIEVREGVTEIRERLEPDGEGDVDFEGLVASADPGGGTVTLLDGTRVRVVEGTEIDADDGDPEELASVQEVADALAEDRTVVAEGEGVLEGTSPRTITAVEAEFEIDDEAEAGDDADDDGPDAPGSFEFEDSVVGADPGAGTFTLEGGAEVRIDGDTRIDPEGDLLDLEAVADAVEDGRPVRAEGDAVEESGGVWRALEVKFEVDD